MKDEKILMMGFTPPEEGGSERHIFELSLRIRNCEVFTQKNSACKSKIEAPMIKKPLFLRNALFMIASLVYAVYLAVSFRKKYDIVHVHENLLYFAIPILKLRHKVFATVHGINGFKFYDNKLLWLFFKSALHFADRIIAVSKEDKKELGREFDNVSYMPNGVDLSAYKGISPKIENKITFIGRIHEQKGIVYLLEAFENIENKFPDFKLEIIGEINDYAKELRERFRSKRIIWRGFVSSRKEIARSLKSAYCIALPSIWEGLPLTLFEALASERPVMLSDIKAFRSVVKDEAVFFKPEDAGALSKKIMEMIKSQKKGESIGKKGARLAEKYGWENIALELDNLYKQPISTKN